jgi:hypothetical protein
MDGLTVAATHAATDYRANAAMIVSLLLASAITFPASGTYTYKIETAQNALYSTTITIATSRDGVRTHEAFGSPTPSATTDQRFDAGLHELSFSAQQTGRDHLTITFAQSEAVYTIGGHTARLELDAPDCTLVADNVLTSSVMLPAVILATGAYDCTYVLSTGVQYEKGFVLDMLPSARPAQAAAGDASVAIDINGLHETVWYDPKTLIPDFIDFGKDIGYAILVR